MIRTGMSGFSYPEWIGEVYPQGTKRNAMLSAYAGIFPVVEINMTFRRRPRADVMTKWHDAVPAEFLFILKANAQITHWRRLGDIAEPLELFLEGAKPLRGKLGPILFQIPENLKFDVDLVDNFGKQLIEGHTYALEPRDGSWLTPEAFDALRRNRLALCLNDDFFEPMRYEQTSDVVYFRFHKDVYTAEELTARATQAASYDADVYAIFQHEDSPESVKPALRFLGSVKS